MGKWDKYATDIQIENKWSKYSSEETPIPSEEKPGFGKRLISAVKNTIGARESAGSVSKDVLASVKNIMTNPLGAPIEAGRMALDVYERGRAALANAIRLRSPIRAFTEKKTDSDAQEDAVNFWNRYVEPTSSVTRNFIQNLPAEVTGFIAQNPDILAAGGVKKGITNVGNAMKVGLSKASRVAATELKATKIYNSMIKGKEYLSNVLLPRVETEVAQRMVKMTPEIEKIAKETGLGYRAAIDNVKAKGVANIQKSVEAMEKASGTTGQAAVAKRYVDGNNKLTTKAIKTSEAMYKSSSKDIEMNNTLGAIEKELLETGVLKKKRGVFSISDEIIAEKKAGVYRPSHDLLDAWNYLNNFRVGPKGQTVLLDVDRFKKFKSLFGKTFSRAGIAGKTGKAERGAVWHSFDKDLVESGRDPKLIRESSEQWFNVYRNEDRIAESGVLDANTLSFKRLQDKPEARKAFDELTESYTKHNGETYNGIDELKDIASDEMLRAIPSKIDVGGNVAGLMSNDQNVIAASRKELNKAFGEKYAQRIEREILDYMKVNKIKPTDMQKILSTMGRGAAWHGASGLMGRVMRLGGLI